MATKNHHLSSPPQLKFRAFSLTTATDDVDSDPTSVQGEYRNLLQTVEENPLLTNADEFLEYWSSIISGVVAGEIPRDVAVQRLKPHLELYPGLAPLVIEQFQIAEYSTDNENALSVDFLLNLITETVAQGAVPLPEVRERMEQEMLGFLRLSEKGSSWDVRYVRTKTKWFFKLQKFNLYREESEGFAELIDVLDQTDASNYSLICSKIMELAGRYDLDVYRIVETILTAACVLPSVLSKVLLEFCDSVDFDVGTLVALLGAKFKLYGQKSAGEPNRTRGLCHVACVLVANGVATWEDIVPHVPLSKGEVELHWKQMFERALAEDRILHTNKRSVKEQFNNQETVSFDGLVGYFEENRNPRIELVTVMFQHGMYHDALRLINEMPAQYASTFEPLAMEIGKVVHYIINPLYNKKSLNLDVMRDPIEKNLPRVVNEELPDQLHSLDDVGDLLEPWLMLLGSNLIYDRRLFVKLLRIFHQFVADNVVPENDDMGKKEDVGKIDLASMDPSQQKIFREILHVIEHCFLPALTRGVGSSVLSEHIFALLKMIPYNIRFTLYYKLKTDYYPAGHPLAIVARAIALSNAKWFQKRVNKDNFKFCGRLVAKDMYNNGIIVCNYLSERIGLFDNFGTLVTDAMKNASAFAADIMLYSILEHMTMPANNNFKHDEMTIMPWYRYTATFSALFVKKLPVEVEPILEYVEGMLKTGQTVDLLILKEIVHKLSGIEVSEGVTDEQLEALAGGEVLKAEGATFSPMRNTKRSSSRLKEALLKSNQALNLCLLISHAESTILYTEDVGKNLKLVGLLYDMCHDTLVQYGTFLATNLTKKEYTDKFPTLADMIRVYKIPFETAIFLLRSVYWNEISTKIDEFKIEQGIPVGTLKENHFRLVQEKFGNIFDDVITSVVDLIAPVMTQAPMEDISLRFYVLFWLLSLYDLYVPKDVYEQEIEKLQQIITQPTDDAGDDLLLLIKRKKEKERAQAVIGRLREEMSVQKQHVQMLRNHLSEEKDRWFQSVKANKNDVVSQFLQMCVLPRATFSTIDALFSAHFISCLHELKTQNFSTLLCYDRMLCDITTALICCSENEASRYGRLLHTVLKTIMRWHTNKATFDEECQHHPGFMTKFRTPSASVSSGENVVDHIDYENFRHVCHKWHFKLTKSMVSCLESESYVRIRNGLIVLDRVLPFYPIVSNFYVAIEKRVQTLIVAEKDKRPDLYSLTYGYMGRLRNQKSLLVLESSFHHRAPGSKKVGGANVSEDAQSEAQRAEEDATMSPKSAPKTKVNDEPVREAPSLARDTVDGEKKVQLPKKPDHGSKKLDGDSSKTDTAPPRSTKIGPTLPPKIPEEPAVEVIPADEPVAKKKSQPAPALPQKPSRPENGNTIQADLIPAVAVISESQTRKRLSKPEKAPSSKKARSPEVNGSLNSNTLPKEDQDDVVVLPSPPSKRTAISSSSTSTGPFRDKEKERNRGGEDSASRSSRKTDISPEIGSQSTKSRTEKDPTAKRDRKSEVAKKPEVVVEDKKGRNAVQAPKNGVPGTTREKDRKEKAHELPALFAASAKIPSSSSVKVSVLNDTKDRERSRPALSVRVTTEKRKERSGEPVEPVKNLPAVPEEIAKDPARNSPRTRAPRSAATEVVRSKKSRPRSPVISGINYDVVEDAGGKSGQRNHSSISTASQNSAKSSREASREKEKSVKRKRESDSADRERAHRRQPTY